MAVRIPGGHSSRLFQSTYATFYGGSDASSSIATSQKPLREDDATHSRRRLLAPVHAPAPEPISINADEKGLYNNQKVTLFPNNVAPLILGGGGGCWRRRRRWWWVEEEEVMEEVVEEEVEVVVEDEEEVMEEVVVEEKVEEDVEVVEEVEEQVVEVEEK